MLQPATRPRIDLSQTTWAADNGCYALGAAFEQDAWLSWLESKRAWSDTCLFATAPDVVGNAGWTIERSLPLLPIIRDMGYKAALVAQDGLENLTVPWDLFDVLFIGGSTKWKLSEAAYGLMEEAHKRGYWVHVGRVNSYRRMRAMKAAFADSVDGTYLKWEPDAHLPKLVQWLDKLALQEGLFEHASRRHGGQEQRQSGGKDYVHPQRYLSGEGGVDTGEAHAEEAPGVGD